MSRITPGAGSPLVIISADMIGAVSRYLPADMWDVAVDLDHLDQVPANVAAAMRVYVRNLDAGYPLDPRIVSMLFEFFEAMAKPAAMAAEIAIAFRAIHKDDIKRDEAPRTNEAAWNVRR